MSSLVKKIILIPLITLAVIFMVLLITPLLFKGKIMDIAKTQLNNMLEAKVDFKDLKLSFIRNFPDAYIALDGLEITGVNDFEDELLVAFKRFSVTVDLMSVIKMDNIVVKSILLDRARLNGHILEDGRANWDIMKSNAESKDKPPKEEAVEITETKEETSSPFAFNVGLRKFEIRNLQASFKDDKSKMAAEMQALNFILRGNMAKEIVDLKLRLGIDGINFWMNGVRLANDASVGFTSQIGADMKNMRFLIKDNRFNLNDIVLNLDGSVEMKEGDINTDVTFSTERTDFKSLLSLVPAIYMTNFKDLRTTGSLALNGDVKGTYNKNQMPIANVNLSVDNASFSYPAVPKSVEKINIAVRAHYDGEVFDNTTADVDRFSFEISGNPFAAELHVKTPESDMEVSAKFAGKIDIESIADIIPMADTSLSGFMECDISLAGKMSTIQNERYQDFQMAGFLNLSRFKYESPAFPLGAAISSTNINFTPRRVQLANLDAIVGSTDVSVTGSLENFIPFIFKDETVRGNLAVRSNNINLNEFMSGEKKEKEVVEKEESSPLSVIEIPKNVNFTLTVNLANILFDKLAITNTQGAIIVRDGKLNMQNLGMNLLDGSMVLNGEYNTQNLAVPFVDFGMNINRFNISTALSSFKFLEKILPNPQNYSGRVSANLTLYSVLDEHLSPVMNSINSRGRLQTQDLQIRNSPLFGAVANLISNESWRNPSLGNINVGFEIKDGRLSLTEPIVINVPPARMEITGDQGLDTTLNYRINAGVPVSAVGSGASDLLNRLPGGIRINEINITGRIQGTPKNPDVSLSMADMAGSITDSVRDQVTERVTQRVDEARAQVSEEINRQIDQIMTEARRQADNVRSTAKQAADRVRNEANTQANRVMSEADNVSNPVQRRIAQEAARPAADRIRSEGESNARKLEQDAETQAQAILSAAERRANDLRR